MRFLTFFYFLERFLFSSGETFYPTKPAKLLNKKTFKSWILNDSYKKFSHEVP